MWEYNSLDELYHHGILGMKWGHHKSKDYNGPALTRNNKPILGLRAFKTKGVDKRRKKANDKVRKLDKKNPGSKRYVKAKIKADKINSSRYGKTNGRLLAEGALKQIGIATIGTTGYKVAKKLGKNDVAEYIKSGTIGASIGNTFNIGTRLIYNYRDKSRKNKK